MSTPTVVNLDELKQKAEILEGQIRADKLRKEELIGFKGDKVRAAVEGIIPSDWLEIVKSLADTNIFDWNQLLEKRKAPFAAANAAFREPATEFLKTMVIVTKTTVAFFSWSEESGVSARTYGLPAKGEKPQVKKAEGKDIKAADFKMLEAGRFYLLTSFEEGGSHEPKLSLSDGYIPENWGEMILFSRIGKDGILSPAGLDKKSFVAKVTNYFRVNKFGWVIGNSHVNGAGPIPLMNLHEMLLEAPQAEQAGKKLQKQRTKIQQQTEQMVDETGKSLWDYIREYIELMERNQTNAQELQQIQSRIKLSKV